VVGATGIGTPAPCAGGTATVTDTGGGPSAHPWGHCTGTRGVHTDLPGPPPPGRAHHAAGRHAHRVERDPGHGTGDAGPSAGVHDRVTGKSLATSSMTSL